MARANRDGDKRVDRNNDTITNWTTLLAKEDNYIYDGQVEINQRIAQRLQDEEGSRSKGETLATLLEEEMYSSVRSDLFVLCAMSSATQTGLERQALTNVEENDVRSCVTRAQSGRLALAANAQTFLDNHWPGWHDIDEDGNANREYPGTVVNELARLCKLGISKADAEVKLKAQIHKRKTARARGVSNAPVLQRADVRAVIMQITDVPLAHVAAPVLKGKKSKGKKKVVYHASSSKTDVRRQPNMSDPDQHIGVPSTNGIDTSPNIPDPDQPSDVASTNGDDAAPMRSSPRQPRGTSGPEQPNSPVLTLADITEPGIEVGRPGRNDHSGLSDSSPNSYKSFDDVGATPAPDSPSSDLTRYRTVLPNPPLTSKRPIVDSPMPNKRSRLHGSQIPEQASRALKISQEVRQSVDRQKRATEPVSDRAISDESLQTIPSFDKSFYNASQMHKRHLTEAETDLRVAVKDLATLRHALQDLEARVARTEAAYQGYRQQAAVALSKEEKAKAEKAECKERAQATRTELRASDAPLEQARKDVEAGVIANREVEEYLEHLRRIPVVGAVNQS